MPATRPTPSGTRFSAFEDETGLLRSVSLATSKLEMNCVYFRFLPCIRDIHLLSQPQRGPKRPLANFVDYMAVSVRPIAECHVTSTSSFRQERPACRGGQRLSLPPSGIYPSLPSHADEIGPASHGQSLNATSTSASSFCQERPACRGDQRPALLVQWYPPLFARHAGGIALAFRCRYPDVRLLRRGSRHFFS